MPVAGQNRTSWPACAVSAPPDLRTIAAVFRNFEEIAQMVGVDDLSMCSGYPRENDELRLPEITTMLARPTQRSLHRAAGPQTSRWMVASHTGGSLCLFLLHSISISLLKTSSTTRSRTNSP